MEHKFNTKSICEMELEATYTYDELKDDFENAFKEESKKIQLPGFRKGKVPVNMIKKMYGPAIEYEASEKIANDKFWDLIEKGNLIPLSKPVLSHLDLKEDKSLNFKVEFEIRPKLENLKYKEFEIKKPIFTLKEEEIEKEIDYIIKPHITYQPAEMITSRNFRIVANLQRLDENKIPLVGSRSENLNIDLSSENINPQIIENTLNKKVGEKFLFDFTHSDDKDGKVVEETFHYEGEVIKIEEMIYPELNDEFIKKITKEKANNLDELRDQIRQGMRNYLDGQSNQIYETALTNKIVEENEFEVPKGFVERILKDKVEDYKKKVKEQGRKENGFTDDELKEKLKENALWSSKWAIIYENIIESENLKISDEEIDKIVQEESEKTSIPVDKLKKYYNDPSRLNSLLDNKVFELLFSNNKAIEIDAENYNKDKKDKK